MSRTRARATKGRFAKHVRPGVDERKDGEDRRVPSPAEFNAAHLTPSTPYKVGDVRQFSNGSVGRCTSVGDARGRYLDGTGFDPPRADPNAPVTSEMLKEAHAAAVGDQTLKKDAGKPPLELISSKALVELAKVLGFGATKYAPDGWRRGMEWRRLIGAALRHLTSFNDGEDRDPETGLLHAAHAMCCCMFLVEYALTKVGRDDRFRRYTDGETDAMKQGRLLHEAVERVYSAACVYGNKKGACQRCGTAV